MRGGPLFARVLPRALPYGLLVGAALWVTLPLFRAAGLPYNVDISGFFPLTPDAYEARFWPLWNERGGMSAAQFLPALMVELPFLLVGHALGWGMDLHIKVRIFFGFALAACAMYALARYHLERHYAERLGRAARIALPLVAALFYAFNPWSVHRVFHYFLWLGYAFAPLVLLAFLHLADAPSWRRALVLALVTALGSTDPHNPPMFALVIAPFAIARALGALRGGRAAALRLARGLALAAFAYLALAAYWIFPYVFSAATDPGFGPTYVLSDEMLGILSQHASLGDVLRLTHNYNPRAPLAPEGGAALAAWNVASLAVPVLALAALVLARRRAAAWAYGALGVASIALGMGSQGAGGVYHWLVFEAPWGEGLSWLFRDPYRWGGIQALAYSALLAFALAELGSFARRAPRALSGGLGVAGPSFALACTALFVAPALGGYVSTVYEPVEVPAEYALANAHLARTPEDSGVVWMPRALGATTWSGERTLAYYDATSSARAAMGPFRPHTSLYFRFLEDAAKDGADVPALLARIGADRVVFHNDRDPGRDASKVFALQQTGLAREARLGETSVRAVDASSMLLANAPAAKYAINGTRALSQTFTPSLRDAVELTILARPVGDPSPLEIRILDAAGNVTATRRISPVPDATEIVVPLNGVRLVPGHAYELRLAGMNGSWNASARWDLSYYKLDAYPSGNMTVTTNGTAWRGLEGDLAFELVSRTRGFIDVLRNPDEAPRVRASDAVIASPASLQVLRALAALPENTTLRDAPVVFTAADDDARAALSQEAPWRWVAPLDASPWEAIVPFLPADTIVAPFTATTSAEGKSEWARGTEEFTYYEYGWSSSLAALKQEAWDFDGNRGLVYTSAPADLNVPIDPAANGTMLLARVYEHPQGGVLRVHAGDALVGSLATRAPVAGFRWREVGVLAAGTDSIRLTGDGSFLGVNLLAAVPPDALDAAKAQSASRFATTPVTLLDQAETAPGLASRVVALPRVGRFAEMNASATLAFDAPANDTYHLWLRLAKGTPAPVVTVDGRPIGPLTCAAACDGPAPWSSVSLQGLRAGAHTLGLAPHNASARPQIDLVAITNDPSFGLSQAPPEVAWERVSATEYRVHVDGPLALALATPYDAGWRARVDGGAPIDGIIADGVTNVFLIEADGPANVTLTFEPQTWAQRGAAVSVASLSFVFAALAASALAFVRARRALREDPEEGMS